MIEVRHLTKRYGNHFAVKDLSFTIKKGIVYGFLGPNGAGKSTTMNIITGCLGATEGTVLVDGHSIVNEPIEAKKHIGYLPEQPPLYTDMTPKEYLRFVARAKGIAGQEILRQVHMVMSKTRVENVQDRLICNLSKGYRQRVGIAQALLGNPEIIILDEPTVGLDPAQMIETRELIRELGKDHTLILSSHILSEVQVVCDAIMIISGGRLVASDTAENLTALFAGKSMIQLMARSDEQAMRKVLAGVEGILELSFSTEEEGITLCSVSAQDTNNTVVVTEETINLPLTAHIAAELVGIEWMVDDRSFSFIKSDIGWQMANDNTYPVEQTKLAELSEALIELTAFRELTNVEAPADYGFENNVFTLTTIWSDNSKSTYIMGTETPFGDGWYLSLGETGIVYVVANDLSKAFDVTLSELTGKESIPTVDTVTRISIGNLDMHKSDDNETWKTSDGTLLDTAKVDDLIASIEKVTWEDLVTTKAVNMTSYGLDADSATTIILQGAESSATILLGSTDETGNYYARLVDSEMVYTIAANTVNSILSNNEDCLWSNALITLSADSVANATFTVGDKAYTYDVQTGADLWNKLINLTANSRLLNLPEGVVVLTVNVTDTEGNAITLAICEYSVDEYAATVDGRYSLVSADTVDMLIRTVKSLV